MIEQIEITLQPKSRGFHLVTGEIVRQLPKLPKTGSCQSSCQDAPDGSEQPKPKDKWKPENISYNEYGQKR